MWVWFPGCPLLVSLGACPLSGIKKVRSWEVVSLYLDSDFNVGYRLWPDLFYYQSEGFAQTSFWLPDLEEPTKNNIFDFFPYFSNVAATACWIHVTVDPNRRASTVSGNPIFSRWLVLRDVMHALQDLTAWVMVVNGIPKRINCSQALPQLTV